MYIILDNVATHKTPEVHKWLVKHPRFIFHSRSHLQRSMRILWSGGSLNSQQNGCTAACTPQWITSVDHLIESMNTWIKTWNDKPRPFIWKKPADDILKYLSRYLRRTHKTLH